MFCPFAPFIVLGMLVLVGESGERWWGLVGEVESGWESGRIVLQVWREMGLVNSSYWNKTSQDSMPHALT
uniref:Uncharacterized protein n=1 Tax=Tanacetum cinerariifolium TaxID=118510 RepID=A0A699GHC5_TANCI|nr:hypothetical protein [Tanacetum cinerariifolium]